MSLINCPECGGQMSTLAKQCIHCGAPVKSCPECGNVWVGEDSLCPKCGINITEAQSNMAENAPISTQSITETVTEAPEEPASEAEPAVEAEPVVEAEPAAEAEPTVEAEAPVESETQTRNRRIVEATLRNYESESILDKVRENYPGGLKFLFKFFGVPLFGILLFLSLGLTMTVDMPETTKNIVRIISLNITILPMIIGSGLSIFNNPIALSRLTASIDLGKFDVNSRISSELNDNWDNGFKNTFKRSNTQTLILLQARQTSVYLRVVQNIIHLLAFLLFGAPMILVGWNMLMIVVTFANTLSSTLGMTYEVTLLIGIIGIIVYILICAIPLSIYATIMSAIERAICSKWVRKNLPDDYDAYRKNILRKKK